ncbi:MAG: efflux RND transporter periplasmic adaptor subunit, partial [Dongiaceae bacterium]
MKRLAFLIVLAGLIGGAGYLLYRPDDVPAAARQTPPAVVVQVATALQRPTPLEIATIGTVRSNATVALKSRVDGEIVEAHVRDGQEVKAGDLLFSIDNRAIRAELAQAEANLARDQALLANARRDVERLAKLASKDYVAKQSFDEIKTNADSLDASVRGNEAAVEAARVQLSYTEIHAPIDGRVGVVNLPRGNIVRANDSTPLVVLNQLRPIDVDFVVPQVELPGIRAAIAAAPLTTSVTVPGDDGPPLTGRLTFIDNAVDAATGTIRLKATFENADTRLWPGQFVNVVLRLRVEPVALVVPDAAVQRSQDGAYVFVVGKDSTVEM